MVSCAPTANLLQPLLPAASPRIGLNCQPLHKSMHWASSEFIKVETTKALTFLM